MTASQKALKKQEQERQAKFNKTLQDVDKELKKLEKKHEILLGAEPMIVNGIIRARIVVIPNSEMDQRRRAGNESQAQSNLVE